jgi:ketosteroid isomerase-like protein
MTLVPLQLDAEQIVRQYYQLLNDKQLEKAAPLLTDDVVRIGVVEPDKPPQLTQGKEQLLDRIRRMIEDNGSAIVNNLHVDGDTVTCFVQISTDTGRREGVAPLEETAEFLIQDGKIKSYRVVSTPESVAKLKAIRQ